MRRPLPIPAAASSGSPSRSAAFGRRARSQGRRARAHAQAGDRPQSRCGRPRPWPRSLRFASAITRRPPQPPITSWEIEPRDVLHDAGRPVAHGAVARTRHPSTVDRGQGHRRRRAGRRSRRQGTPPGAEGDPGGSSGSHAPWRARHAASRSSGVPPDRDDELGRIGNRRRRPTLATEISATPMMSGPSTRRSRHLDRGGRAACGANPPRDREVGKGGTS